MPHLAWQVHGWLATALEPVGDEGGKAVPGNDRIQSELSRRLRGRSYRPPDERFFGGRDEQERSPIHPIQDQHASPQVRETGEIEEVGVLLEGRLVPLLI